MRPWEVRFAHPCRARARHPIHKAMGGHASHGRTSDRAFIRLGWSVSPNNSRRRKKKRPGNTPRSLNNVRATETATDVSILPREMSRSDRGVRNREALSVFQNSSRRRKKRDRGTRPRSLKNVQATETATDVSVLPREMSRSDRGVRGREALSVCPNSVRGHKKKRPKEHSSIS